MNTPLYKVSAPRPDLLFHPSTFWHSPDWESSTTRYRAGYIEEQVLYAGDFDEVNIHLFPRVRTVRVRARDADLATMHGCGLPADPGRTAYISCAIACRAEVEAFTPTVFTFDPQGFTRVRHGEHVSWVPQRARSCATWSMVDAIRAWNIQVCYVPDLDAVITQLARRGVYFDEQT